MNTDTFTIFCQGMIYLGFAWMLFCFGLSMLILVRRPCKTEDKPASLPVGS